MVNQQVTLSTIICALLFSGASVASTHIAPQISSPQNGILQSTESSTDSHMALVAATDNAMFNGMSEFNAVAEFAMQVSSFEHESGGKLSSGASHYGSKAGYLPRVDSGQHGLTTITGDNGGVSFHETGTLLLVTLGFAALTVSRRRTKFAHDAGGQAPGKATPAGDVEQPTKISVPGSSTARTTDRNPYPELAQSVQKLEALAHEMEHLS